MLMPLGVLGIAACAVLFVFVVVMTADYFLFKVLLWLRFV